MSDSATPTTDDFEAQVAAEDAADESAADGDRTLTPFAGFADAPAQPREVDGVPFTDLD